MQEAAVCGQAPQHCFHHGRMAALHQEMNCCNKGIGERSLSRQDSFTQEFTGVIQARWMICFASLIETFANVWLSVKWVLWQCTANSSSCIKHCTNWNLNWLSATANEPVIQCTKLLTNQCVAKWMNYTSVLQPAVAVTVKQVAFDLKAMNPRRGFILRRERCNDQCHYDGLDLLTQSYLVQEWPDLTHCGPSYAIYCLTRFGYRCNQ